MIAQSARGPDRTLEYSLRRAFPDAHATRAPNPPYSGWEGVLVYRIICVRRTMTELGLASGDEARDITALAQNLWLNRT